MKNEKVEFNQEGWSTLKNVKICYADNHLGMSASAGSVPAIAGIRGAEEAGAARSPR